MWYVYIIQSDRNKKYYIGCSNDYRRRIEEHNNGENSSTRLTRPWKLVRLELFKSQTEAFEREKKIKSYKGGNAFKKLLS